MLDNLRAKVAAMISPRAFKAARMSRLESDWVTSFSTTNDELKQSLEKLILRSRDLAKNNSDYIKWLGMRETNIVGEHGVRLVMKVKNLDGSSDKVASAQIETHFQRWGKKRNGWCAVDRAMDWIEVQTHVDRSVAVDGECFIRIVEGADNPYHFALQFIDPLEIDINHTVDFTPPGKNRIVMGVELDSNDRPVAYYRKRRKGTSGFFAADYERIPASTMLHVFHVNFTGQVRGYPLASGAILDLNMAEGYKETSLVGARVAAAQMGIWTPDKNAAPAQFDPDTAESASDAPPEMDVTPGKIIRGKKGWSFTPFTPTQPVSAFAGFIKSIYRSIANGLGVAYNNFRNDLENVNFSSLRGGSQAERDRWKIEQRFLIASFNEFIFARWLRMLLVSGLTDLPLRKYTKFLADTWQPRRWTWVDPRADATANKTKLEMRITSRRRLCAEMGDDIVDIMDELQDEEKELERRGLTADAFDKKLEENNEQKAKKQVA